MTVEQVKNYAEHLGWKVGVDFPEWANTEAYVFTITKGYLLKGETPRMAYKRVANEVAEILNKPFLFNKFFDYIWKGWLCLASPVLSNVGAFNDKGKARGLSISCYGLTVPDSIYGIGVKNLEMMVMAKNGGGVAVDIDNIRGAGVPITDNGTSDGVVPFCKIFDSSILATNQGSVRRGAAVTNLGITHRDFMDWLEVREPKGDVNRQSLNTNQCAVIPDSFMHKVIEGDKEARKRWGALLQKGVTSGEPYILWSDNVNKVNPPGYKQRGMEVTMTNLCSEITLFSDEEHSFVCCLSSLNLYKYEEWKDTDLVYTATVFLDGVLECFLREARKIRGMECAVRFSEKSRAIGLGALGWHSFLQSKGVPFDSIGGRTWTRTIFGHIQAESDRASQDLAKEYGEPEWCEGTGYRNTHRRAVAPTVSNSKLSGNVSPSTEPWAANQYTEESAKGTFIRRNGELVKVLEEIGLNTEATWQRIRADQGSVQGLDELDNWWFDDEGKVVPVTDFNAKSPVKSVFRTFKEINQLELVRQAGVRQEYVDQACSVNLRFPAGVDPKFVNQVHIEMWKLGIKTRYYVRTESVLRADIISQATSTTCQVCEA